MFVGVKLMLNRPAAITTLQLCTADTSRRRDPAATACVQLLTQTFAVDLNGGEASKSSHKISQRSSIAVTALCTISHGNMTAVRRSYTMQRTL